MKIFTVTKEGVYRHEIVGIYDNLSVAQERAHSEATKEGEDGYHEYWVCESYLNEDCKDVKQIMLYQGIFEWERVGQKLTIPRKRIDKGLRFEVIEE